MLNEKSLNQVLIGIGGAAIGTKGTHEDRVLYAKNNVERLCDLATDYGHSAVERLTEHEDADETWKLYSLLLEYGDVVINKSQRTWHVPLEIDMTCSGLSLFSGILRDPVGMLATNALMSPDGLVQDAYRNVVETAMGLLEHSITLNITSNELPFKSPEFRAWRKIVTGAGARKHTHTPASATQLYFLPGNITILPPQQHNYISASTTQFYLRFSNITILEGRQYNLDSASALTT